MEGPCEISNMNNPDVTFEHESSRVIFIFFFLKKGLNAYWQLVD